MARQCNFCLRSSLKATSRSHSNIGSLRRQHINLQSKKIQGIATKICSSCLKTIKKKLPALMAVTPKA